MKETEATLNTTLAEGGVVSEWVGGTSEPSVSPFGTVWGVMERQGVTDCCVVGLQVCVVAVVLDSFLSSVRVK